MIEKIKMRLGRFAIVLLPVLASDHEDEQERESVTTAETDY